MTYYCARLLVVCLVDDGKPRKKNTCDYQFIIIKAPNEAVAFERALACGRKSETRYKNSKGQYVRWAFVAVEQITVLGRRLDGMEVGSLLDVHISERAVPFRKKFKPETVQPRFEDAL